jgi:hypothetical protein
VLLYYSITCGMHCFTIPPSTMWCDHEHCLLGSPSALGEYLYCLDMLCGQLIPVCYRGARTRSSIVEYNDPSVIRNSMASLYRQLVPWFCTQKL